MTSVFPDTGKNINSNNLTMKYLSEIEIQTLVKLGKTLEMFLGQSTLNYEIINWISLAQVNAATIEVCTYSIFDEGDLYHLDVYSFAPENPDEFFDTKEFSTLDEALTFIRTAYNLKDLKFLNAGRVQDEYERLVKNGR